MGLVFIAAGFVAAGVAALVYWCVGSVGAEGWEAALDRALAVETAECRFWNEIVIHHSATESGSAADFDRWHREGRGWDQGLGYHFVIGNGRGSGDGAIEASRRWREQLPGAHARQHNQCGIVICLVGDFEEGRPTPAQMESLGRLLDRLTSRFSMPESHIILHRDVGRTKCPGRNLTRAAVLGALETARSRQP